jgi:hypothetical protein
MIHQSRPRYLGASGLLLVLLAAALLVGAAHAAAPPLKPADAVAEPPAGGPLFEEKLHADPIRMALAVLGASTTPTGPLSAGAALCGGEHPRVRAWSFEGVMTNRITRLQCGVATAFLAGFRGATPGLASVTELATLKAGDDFFCWALRDTDRFIPLPKAWLAVIEDGKGFGLGRPEANTYSQVLTRANYTSAKAFHKAVKKDLSYSHLFNDPDTYRGAVVQIEGKLKRINRFPPPREAADEGVNDLYEAWIFGEDLGTNPYCVVFTAWPDGLPRDLLGREKIKGDYRVRGEGYFYKKFRYEGADKSRHEAPLLIGHTLTVVKTPGPTGEDSESWLRWLTTIIVGIFAGMAVLVIGLTWWFRRTDLRIRKKILSSGSPEFVLPPPDALPVARPVAPHPRPNGGPPPRAGLPPSPITFSPGAGDRGEPSDEGGKRGSSDKPPDEGAGA